MNLLLLEPFCHLPLDISLSEDIYVAANLFMKCFAIPLHILHPDSQLWNLAFNALGEKFREGHLVNKCRQKNMKFKELFCIFCLRRVECFQALLSEEMVVHVWIYFRKYFWFDLLVLVSCFIVKLDEKTSCMIKDLIIISVKIFFWGGWDDPQSV